MTTYKAGGLRILVYDPDWPRQAAEAIDALNAAAPGLFAAIEHIGSTAVPGLAAKPVIDLMAAVRELDEVGPHLEALADNGFRPHDNGMTDRLLFVRADSGVRTHILHVVTLESWPTRNQRILRDYLRHHPEDAARYANRKREIVAAGTAPGEYAKAKTALVQELTDRARTERGLPPEPVWEKRLSRHDDRRTVRPVSDRREEDPHCRAASLGPAVVRDQADSGGRCGSFPARWSRAVRQRAGIRRCGEG